MRGLNSVLLEGTLQVCKVVQQDMFETNKTRYVVSYKYGEEIYSFNVLLHENFMKQIKEKNKEFINVRLVGKLIQRDKVTYIEADHVEYKPAWE